MTNRRATLAAARMATASRMSTTTACMTAATAATSVLSESRLRGNCEGNSKYRRKNDSGKNAGDHQ